MSLPGADCFFLGRIVGILCHTEAGTLISGSHQLSLEGSRPRIAMSSFKDAALGHGWLRLPLGSGRVVGHSRRPLDREALVRRLIFLLGDVGQSSRSFRATVAKRSVRRVGGIGQAGKRNSTGGIGHSGERVMRRGRDVYSSCHS